MRAGRSCAADPVTDGSQLAQVFDFCLDVDLVDVATVKRLDDAFRNPDGSEHEKLVRVFDVDVEAAPGINPPVPLCFTLEVARSGDLALKLDNEVLEEMGYLRGARLPTERKAVFVVTVVVGKVWEQFEQQFGYVGGMLCRVTIGVGHLNNKFDPIAIVEEYLYYFQLRHSCLITRGAVCVGSCEARRSGRGCLITLILAPDIGAVKWSSIILSPHVYQPVIKLSNRHAHVTIGCHDGDDLSRVSADRSSPLQVFHARV